MNILTVADIQRIIAESAAGQDYVGAEDHGNSPLYYRFVYRLAQAVRPDLIVELGTHHGAAAMRFSAGSLGSRVISIDWNPPPKHPIYTNLQFWQGDTKDSSQRVADLKTPIDILFLDSTHEAAHAIVEFNLYWPLLRSGGIFLADDIYLADMRDFWQIVPEPKFLDDNLNATCGFGLAIKQ